MKKVSMLIITSIFAVLISSCGMSKEDISETVKNSMQETLNTNTSFKEYELKVDGITLFKKSDNNYKGIVSIIYKGTSHDVSVDVLVDGDSVMWEASPGAFMFIAQENLQQLQDQLQNLFE